MGSLELDTTEQLHFDFSLSCIGEGNGNPLQCSCLENPRDGGAWWAAIYGVAQSRTWLKWLSSSSSRVYECLTSGHRTKWFSKVSWPNFHSHWNVGPQSFNTCWTFSFLLIEWLSHWSFMFLWQLIMMNTSHIYWQLWNVSSYILITFLLGGDFLTCV